MNGGCLCGAVRYKCDAQPIYQLYCHCRDCQRASGSAFAPVIFFRTEDFSIAGEVTYYQSKGSSGKRHKPRLLSQVWISAIWIS